MVDHSEISVSILSDQALDHYLFAYDAAQKYPNRSINAPISVLENSHALACIALLSISLEAYFNRLIYFLSKRDAIFKKLFTEDSDAKLGELLEGSSKKTFFKNRFDEVMAVRNAVAHAHIYQTDRTLDRNILKVSALIMRKDKRWSKVVDSKNRYRTKLLNLNTIPSEICFDDVRKFLIFWQELYKELERTNGQIVLLPPIWPHVYSKFHNGKQDLKLNQFFGSDGSFSTWKDFQSDTQNI